MTWMWLLLLLAPGFFIIPFTLVGLALLPFYGVEKIRWYKGAIEVVAKTNKDGSTRIFGQPAAQTIGLFIFYAREKTEIIKNRKRSGWDDPALRVHERVHILQPLIFGVLYVLVYGLSFLALIVAVLFGAWKNAKPKFSSPIWRAYYRIPFEIWAYSKQHRFEGGEIPDAWGA